MSPEIDRGIDELCALRRLSAVSCLVALRACARSTCQSLRRHESHVDLGLHLCLTEEGSDPLESGPPPARNLRALWAGVTSGRIKQDSINTAVAAQFRLFEEKFGRPPDFLDGHLHAHQLPTVRCAVVEFLSSLPRAGRPYVRNTATDATALKSARLPWLKAWLIGRFGIEMRLDAAAAEVPTNNGFVGIYNLSKWKDFPHLFPRFADCAREANSILVVHPGRTEGWRQTEFETLREFAPTSIQTNRFQR